MKATFAAALLAAGAAAQQTIQAKSFLVLRHATTTYSPNLNVTAPVAVEEWQLSEDGTVGTLVQVRRSRRAALQLAPPVTVRLSHAHRA